MEGEPAAVSEAAEPPLVHNDGDMPPQLLEVPNGCTCSEHEFGAVVSSACSGGGSDGGHESGFGVYSFGGQGGDAFEEGLMLSQDHGDWGEDSQCEYLCGLMDVSCIEEHAIGDEVVLPFGAAMDELAAPASFAGGVHPSVDDGFSYGVCFGDDAYSCDGGIQLSGTSGAVEAHEELRQLSASARDMALLACTPSNVASEGSEQAGVQQMLNTLTEMGRQLRVQNGMLQQHNELLTGVLKDVTGE